MSDRPKCQLTDADRDESGCFPIQKVAALGDCELPTFTKTLCFVAYTGESMEEETNASVHVPPAIAKKPAAPAPVVEEVATVESEAPAALPELPVTPVQVQEFATTAAKDIAPLLEKPTDTNGVLVALIAVAGGGAAWKFYSQFSKNKHEENMEKLRLESEKQKNNDHQQCNAKHLALNAKVEELTAKLEAAEQKLASVSQSKSEGLNLDLDVDDMKDRIEKLEKALKAKPKKKSDS